MMVSVFSKVINFFQKILIYHKREITNKCAPFTINAYIINGFKFFDKMVSNCKLELN